MRTICLQMAAYLVCLTAGGGVPLFSRTKGDLKPLPFPVIGSLNAVHMFAENHKVDLQTTTTHGSKIAWKVYQDSITLIVATGDDCAADCHLAHLLDNIYNAMVLMYGSEEVGNIKNVERFKKEIKVCFNLVDALLDQACLPTFSDLTNAPDIIAGPENSILQNFLDAFAEAAGSHYGCLLVHGKIAVATRKWWSFSPTELVLLSLVVPSMPQCSSRDVPVFLPQLSPTVPHRLLTFQLLKHVEVCILTGPTPSLTELSQEVTRFWRAGQDTLKALRNHHPRNYPPTLGLDHNILGFVVVNTESPRCLCSVDFLVGDRSKPPDRILSPDRKREILRAFYKKVIGTYLSATIENSTKGPSEFPHQAMETYVVCESHKCYALQEGQHQIFIIYDVNIPTFAMRSVTQKTLTALVKDKVTQL